MWGRGGTTSKRLYISRHEFFSPTNRRLTSSRERRGGAEGGETWEEFESLGGVSSLFDFPVKLHLHCLELTTLSTAKETTLKERKTKARPTLLSVL